MSKKRSYDLYKEHSLGTFFLLVFIAVGLIAAFWYTNRRTNFYAHKHDDGVDVVAPFYEGKESAEMEKEHGEAEGKSESVNPEAGGMQKEAEEKENGATEAKKEGSEKK
jgi:hypothetical protein